jgi:hypothetical protein
MSQLTPGINLITSSDSDSKVFIAFEKKTNNPAEDGIYFNEIDKNSIQIPHPYNTATRVIPSGKYNDNIVEHLELYANKEGTEATITIVVFSGSGNQRIMHTGRIVNRTYTQCDTPTTINGYVSRIEAHYISQHQKFKIYVLRGGAGGGWEGH